MIFRQLFEPNTCTLTYLLGCRETGTALLIDPVVDTAERDLLIVKDLGLALLYTVETHIHADHLSGAHKLQQLAGCQIAVPAADNLSCANVPLVAGRPLNMGTISLLPLHTPGHTATHHCYLSEDRGIPMIFTGDALLIEGCGRTDFQEGDAGTLYDSIMARIFSLPDETLIFPGHDYNNRRISSVAQEKLRNPRLGGNTPRDEFVAIMNGLNLPKPAFIDYAVPGNRACGKCPPNVPEHLKNPCTPAETLQG